MGPRGSGKASLHETDGLIATYRPSQLGHPFVGRRDRVLAMVGTQDHYWGETASSA